MAARWFISAGRLFRSFTSLKGSTSSLYVQLKRCVAYSVIGGGIVGGASLWYNYRDELYSPILSLAAAEESTAQKKVSRREKRYMEFSSIMYNEEIYMTSRDFIESLMECEPRLKQGYEILRGKAVDEMLKLAPNLKRGGSHFLRDTWNDGLLTYADYLFLLTAVTKPRRHFEIAFKLIDVDESGYIDKSEFVQVEESVIKQRDAAILQQNALKDSSLIKYLFGQRGNQKLNFKDFMNFIEKLQREIWEAEFNQFAKGNPTITEENFARILLQHTAYNLESVFKRLPAEREGISFDQYSEFCQLLNSLDDFGITLTIYTMANTPVTPDEFNRAVNACMGKPLDQTVVNAVFQIFDVDGDGKLSNEEFLTVMKNWKLRSSKRRATKSEGFWQDFRACVKSEIRHASPLASVK